MEKFKNHKIETASEEVKKQEVKNDLTVGKKFLFAIIGGLILLISSGILGVHYATKIVETSDSTIGHSLKMKELAFELLIDINKYKAAVAMYSGTEDRKVKIEIIKIRSELLEGITILKEESKIDDMNTKISHIAELLNIVLMEGKALTDKIQGINEKTTSTPIKIKNVEESEKEETFENLDLDNLSLDDLDLDNLDDLALGSFNDLDNRPELERKEDLVTAEDENSALSLEELSLEKSVITLVKNTGIEEYNLAVSKFINFITENILESYDARAEKAKKSINYYYLIFQFFQIGFTILLMIYLMGLYWAFTKNTTEPIKKISKYLIKIGKGELPDFKMKILKGDIGEMISAVKDVLSGLKSTALFAKELGNGNLDANFTALSDKDVLGNALLNMRNRLLKLSDEDEKRNWVNQGVASFAEILRTNNNNIEILTDQIILYLVNYLKANQGAIFLINDLAKKDIYLELSSIYAWDRKKFVEQKIEKGQGLVGQCWYEQKTIYLTDIPTNFINITSGLGEATPNSILIVPLISNEEIYGVLEIASFKTLEAYEVEYIEKVAENIAAAIGNVKITEQTKSLLEEAQQQGEELRANEEEMRQNMEEMNATQEEMQRVLQEKDNQISELNEELNAFKK